MLSGMLVPAFCVLVATAGMVSSPQSTTVVRGKVVDAKTNAPISDALVTLVEANGRTARTGPDGRFEFADVVPRKYTLTVSTTGYVSAVRSFEGKRGATIDFLVPLANRAGEYEERVTVAAALASQPKAIGVSSQAELGSAELAEIRGVAADDPMRAMQALPGVATGDDYRADFSIRGSAFRHVGIVLDGTSTRLLMHTIRHVNDSGSIGMINTDILARAALAAGPHARPHGDWLGATVEFDVREGSRDRTGARFAVSGTAASALFEGPLGKGRRGSWLLSIRKSYLDWLVRELAPHLDNTMGFRDAHAKFTFDITPRQQLQLFGVIGDAAFHEPQTGLANGIHLARSYSGLASLRWRYATPRTVFTEQLSLLRNTYGTEGIVGQHLAYGVMDATVWRNDVTMALRRGWTIEGGTRIEWSDGSETQRNFQAAGDRSVRIRREQVTIADPTTLGAWGQMSWRGAKSGLVVGLRAADRTGGVTAVAAPWLLAERMVGRTQVRAGVGRSFQFVDPILASLSPGGFDPERALAFDLGMERPIGRGSRLQVTAFSRRDANILGRTGEARLDAATGAIVAPATPFAVFSDSLGGTTKGLDVLVSRRSSTGPSGWIGYTWSRTRYRDRATGETFDADFDQRHTLNVFAQQRLSDRLSISGKLRLGTNFPIAGYFTGSPLDLSLGSERNQVRLPFYSRLDLRVDRAFTFNRSRLTLFVEVMNLLDHQNGRQSEGSINPVTLRATGFLERLLPRVPSAGLLFEF
jgi:hypothetical protein